MDDFSRLLGDAVKRARGKMKLTQSEVAAKANIDVRTVLNIENYKGNPKLEVLFPLIRTLNLDPMEIFYPNMSKESPERRQIQQIIGECSDEEMEAMLPVLISVLSALRRKDNRAV